MKNKRFKINNIWKIIWIIGIYLVLILIFGLVVRYKVEWESKDLNRYLYFYKCGSQLCTSDIEQAEYYNKMLCNDNICPYIIDQKHNYLILNNNNNIILYDYTKNQIINDQYIDYYFINNDVIAVLNNENKYGLMDFNGILLSEVKYNKIIDYSNGYLIYLEDKKYAVKNIVTNQDVISGYDEISFVDEKYLILKQDNAYMLYNYNQKKELKQKYNYLYSYNGYVLTFNNNKIDILDKNQKSVLIIKINSFYNYLTKQEQSSLNIREENGNLLFNVVNSENKYITYSFNLNTGKLNN